MRTITIDSLNPNDVNNVNVITEGKLHEAIGYLSIWAVQSPTINLVKLWVSPDGSVEARYFKAGCDKVDYVIGAIWRTEEKTYSFHS